MTHAQTQSPRWALVLGASSGFGGACVRALARAGYDIAGVHLDRKGTLDQVAEVVEYVKAQGREALFFNINAADEERRAEVIAALKERKANVAVLMHSLAFGTLKPYIGDDILMRKNIEMTLDVMAHSLVYWAQDVVGNGLMGNGGRILSMTSSGSTRVIPAYGAVSAAKCALESHTRQLAIELAPRAITVNALRGGVTDTPASRKIPGADVLFDKAARHNPYGRLTVPEDVANAVVALCSPGTDWITGNVINVDGGEEVKG